MAKNPTTESLKALQKWNKIPLREHFQRRKHFILCMVTAALLAICSSFVGNNGQSPEAALIMLMVALGFDVLGITILARQIVREKKNSLHNWALEEAERQEIALLPGKTTEELQRIVDFHLKHGNIKEADTTSQRLISLAEKENPQGLDAAFDALDALDAGPSTAADGSTLHVNQSIGGSSTPQGNGERLPDWIKDGNERKKEKEKENLPQWMQ